ncbi:hypothetical protein B488_11360 [Liberibacter crescens BT-1]|uniref:L,D-TPase catalytic domain-containing protein n=1 Tax=Liberibacter crescens (strain BT-1) TaxID=1215343 RepID=L0EWV3_LIBCB|nr:murein L,D-transpeptidase family protein [Liberibacter crescens]AGA65128.1 hypothetical protein B488_11360 [Liberibacter crescens BT-1]
MIYNRIIFIIAITIIVTGCSKNSEKSERPVSYQLNFLMKEKNMRKGSPILIRIFKEESILEVWKKQNDQKYGLLVSYKICAWSGQLGPKMYEGDRQSPEGFYEITQKNLNQYSSYYLAIDTGFPNVFDKANARTGKYLMIHGSCSSSGCYSMTDEQIQEIYALARDSFRGGQKILQIQAFPFRMTAKNMVLHRSYPSYTFWKMLQVGYDYFEITHQIPIVGVCDKKYIFNQNPGKFLDPIGSCPPDLPAIPADLSHSYTTYKQAYQTEYNNALEQYNDVVWYDPTENERKAIAPQDPKKKAKNYAPTGSALKAGKLLKIKEWQERVSNQQPGKVNSNSASETSKQLEKIIEAESRILIKEAVLPDNFSKTTSEVPIPRMRNILKSLNLTGNSQ